ncbi:MAG: GDSL-type esterase/lipase family protein [Qipengyuania sp.]
MRTLVAAAPFCGAFGWGLAAGAYEVFPYELIRGAKNAIDGDDGTRDPAAYLDNPLAPEVGASDPQWGTRADNVVIGDSLVAQARIEEMFPGASIANRGVGGDTIQGAIDRLPGILELQPKRALIFTGHNDILFRNPTGAIVARFGTLVARLKEAGVAPVIQSVLICGDIPTCDDDKRQNAVTLNARLEELAQNENIPFVDLNATMAGDDGLKPEMTWDGLHLNAAGNRAWRDLAAPYVLERSAAGGGS